MSWAKIDDNMTFHAKVLRAGNEAVGAWVRMIAHCCAHLTDGLVDRIVAESIAPQKVIDRCVSAGLLDVDGDNYRVHDFLDWNPPAADVRAKRERDSARKSLGRRSQARGADGRVRADVHAESARTDIGRPHGIPPDGARNPIACPPVPSRPVPSMELSGESSPARPPAREGPDPESAEPAPPPAPASPPARSGPRLAAARPEPQAAGSSQTERYVQPGDPLTPELRDAAAMIGVRDVETAWLKFTGKQAGKWVHVSGAWQSFCASWRSIEAAERTKAAAAGPGGPPPRVETADDYRARQRRADAEHERLRATAAPAPVADLMAALGAGKPGAS